MSDHRVTIRKADGWASRITGMTWEWTCKPCARRERMGWLYRHRSHADALRAALRHLTA